MKIIFMYSALCEYRKLVYNLYNAETGFYKNVGMFLSHKPSNNPLIVVLPQIMEITCKDFWQEYDSIKKNIPRNYTKFNGSEFPALFSMIKNQPAINPIEQQKEWKNVANDFTKTLGTLFEDDKLKVTVNLTRFGTVASYNHTDNKLDIYLRLDSDISQIAFCILSYFVHKYKQKLHWNEEQRVVDFLLLSSKFKLLFPKFKSILDYVQYPEVDYSLITSSNNIYKKLGINLGSSIKKVKDEILVNGKSVTTLSSQEKIVLEILLKNRNKVTTMDQISISLWGEDYANFSMQAISKTVERLRTKLRETGINRQSIFTKRKLGYVLVD